MRTSALILLLLTLVGCAETDPYKRLEPAPTPELTGAAVTAAFNERWPEQFKCVQTVTIDFRITTRTLVGYLVVQRPDRFRLQGMTEQGLKLFDVVGDGSTETVVFAAEEFDGKVITNIARDIRRVFLLSALFKPGWIRTRPDFGHLRVDEAQLQATELGTRAKLLGQSGDLSVNLVGDPAHVDWYEYQQSDRPLYRVDQYDWREQRPSTIVLREPGVQSDGPPYKLTIKITEFTARDKPWPDRLFEPKEGG
ncbi:MAG: hypothetical protein KDB90_10805 [Planctomycetes bacterium]|nr:hypothetical protein [Planctomycetota bacterium]